MTWSLLLGYFDTLWISLKVLETQTSQGNKHIEIISSSTIFFVKQVYISTCVLCVVSPVVICQTPRPS